MTVQELKSIKTTRARIKELDEAIETLTSEMEKTTPTLSQAPCQAGEGDKRASQIARMVELRTERIELYTRLEEVLESLRIWLCTLPKQQVKVMYARYMQGMSWALVARVTGYKKDHCRKIHDNAIKKIC